MKKYNFHAIEKKWQQYWKKNQSFHAKLDINQPKYYVLDMFPYPSGEGLHVGHPLGYVASDVVGRYKMNKGFNVLHPMGYDAFGLPAEQYAIQTGQHPALTTEKNIQRYQQQLEQLGLGFDWQRAVRTTDPEYYHWTQWIFIQLFESWYDQSLQKARPIKELIEILAKEGNENILAACDEETPTIAAKTWNEWTESKKQQHLCAYRLAYLADTTVNWCPELGTVLANEEVKDGFSERGGFPVIQKKMQQWSLRITAYAERLLQDLDGIDWTDALKTIQRNWIGKSEGAELTLAIKDQEDLAGIKVYTTRPDTIFGTTFIVVAPEHPLVKALFEKKADVKAYVDKAKNRSERERAAEATKITGVDTGYFAINPISGEELPIWVADYVLAGYGTGAIIAVPAHDDRDYAFAKHFDLPITQVIDGGDISEKALMTREGKMIHSDFLNGLPVNDAIQKILEVLEERKLGKRKTNYRLRDAIFSRQRYWGEPIPIYYNEGMPYSLPEEQLPLILPQVSDYKPTPEGDPPLGNAQNWTTAEGDSLELNTMPGWAGSSWYWFRYMDPHNKNAFVGAEEQAYWGQVDLYIGGSEHATGHLLYSRFWTKFLYDIGFIDIQEPFKKLINQGMIQGVSTFVYRIKGAKQFVSYNLREQYETTRLHVANNLVKEGVLDIDGFKKWRPDFKDATFILEKDQYICGTEVEKMSKSKYNVVNPEEVIEKYGADTLRLYELFLGPLEQAKPWNTKGIEGVYRFLLKFWKLFHNAEGNLDITTSQPDPKAIKALHKAIKKVEEDINRYSFNTAISALMIAVNDLTALKCKEKEVLAGLVILLAPLAPHLSEELWEKLGNKESVTQATYPAYDASLLQESSYEYPISINGKVRTKIAFSLEETNEHIEKAVLQDEVVQKWLQGKAPKKVIIIPKRIVNVVV